MGSLGIGGHEDLSLESFCNFLSNAEGKVWGWGDMYEEMKGQVSRLLYKLQIFVRLRSLGKRVTLPSKSKDIQEANLGEARKAKAADNQ